MGIGENLSSCLGGIGGRASLMAVSKTHPWEAVMEAYAAGQRLFGENRVQEAMAKFPVPDERPEGMELCLIGHLQGNKAKKAVSFFDRIDSVDSAKLIELIGKEASLVGKRQRILLELNTSGEESKTGFSSAEELIEAARLCRGMDSVALEGLMTVGPLGGGREANISAFTRLREVYGQLNAEGFGLSVLSMGMSGDWEDAIACGSNLVRIGTAIFGARDYAN